MLIIENNITTVWVAYWLDCRLLYIQCRNKWNRKYNYSSIILNIVKRNMKWKEFVYTHLYIASMRCVIFLFFSLLTICFCWYNNKKRKRVVVVSLRNRSNDRLCINDQKDEGLAIIKNIYINHLFCFVSYKIVSQCCLYY